MGLGLSDFLQPLLPPHWPSLLSHPPRDSSHTPELDQSHSVARKPGFLPLPLVSPGAWAESYTAGSPLRPLDRKSVV